MRNSWDRERGKGEELMVLREGWGVQGVERGK